MADEVDDQVRDTEPPIFIDEAFFNTHDRELTLKREGQAYSVNSDIYYDRERPYHELVQFQLHAGRRSNIPEACFLRDDDDDDENLVVYCSTPESDTVEDVPTDDTELKLTIKKVPHGVVINSNVYLTDEQWNTLVNVDHSLLKCVVCEVYTDKESFTIHLDRESHKDYLQKYKPIAKYDLSITREIRGRYHCGVCNQTFRVDDESDHYASKTHEEYLLSAINKVSDIELSLRRNDGQNTDCYHFNANTINNIGKSDDYYYFNTNKWNDYDDSSVAGSYNDEEDDDDNGGFWGVGDKTPNDPGSSYATMAKKPKLADLPAFIVKDLGSKRVKVRFDSYHMLIAPKLNRFYCMACKEYSHIRVKTEHINNGTHLQNLNDCKVTDKFGDYFVREVDDKFYHCGHCNNLVFIVDMEDHLEKRHSYVKKNALGRPKSNSETDHSSGERNVVNCSPTDDTTVNDEGAYKTKESQLVENNNNRLNKNKNAEKSATASLDEIIVLTPFGYKVAIQLWSFHVICKREYDYYCGMCNAICSEECIVPHVCSISHIQMIQRTPFIVPFNCHLIRAVREKLHCAICNAPVSASLIYDHIKEPLHCELLAKALSVNVGAPIILPPNNILPPNIHHLPSNIQHLPPNIQHLPPNIQHLPPNIQHLPPNNISRLPPNNIQHLPLNNVLHLSPNKVQNPLGRQILGLSPKKPPRSITKQAGHLTEKAGFSGRASPLTVNSGFETEKAGSLIDQLDVVTEESGSEIEIPVTEEVTEEKAAKNVGPTDDMEVTLNESIESVDFDFEDHVYVKVKLSYFKISSTSYNSLVHIGGLRYCFVCSIKVHEEKVKKHVESRDHVKNLKECQFLEKYEGVLLRQIFLMYHCGTCNVLISRRELKNHLNWPIHTKETSYALNVSKKSRKNDVKSGMNIYQAITVKEVIYLNEKEPKTKVHFKIKLGNSDIKYEKKKKIVIIGGDVLKINFENWHSICKTKFGFKCQLCLVELREGELGRHFIADGHVKALVNPFNKENLEHLLREINDNTLHCMICNTEVSNKAHIIKEHIDGKRHKSNLDVVRQMSSETNAYTDCEIDVLQL